MSSFQLSTVSIIELHIEYFGHLEVAIDLFLFDKRLEDLKVFRFESRNLCCRARSMFSCQSADAIVQVRLQMTTLNNPSVYLI